MEKTGCVFLDLGGVLYQTDYAHLWGELAGMSAKTKDDVKRALYGGHFEKFESGGISGEEYYRAVRDGLKASFSFQEFADAWNGLLVRRDSVFRLVGELASQIPIAFISNTNEINVAYMEDDLAALGGRGIFSCEVGLLKPDPAIYRYAMDEMGVLPEESLFVDDREENVRGAAAVKMRAHLYDSEEGFVRLLRGQGFRLTLQSV
jgi:FMN phosphatase YigB (HAD superfamily)